MNKLGLQHTIHVHVTTLACIFLVVNCLEKSGTYRRNEEDGLEGNLAFCSEMDFSKEDLLVPEDEQKVYGKIQLVLTN